MNEEIDFVIIWVDGNDPKWIKEKSNYTLQTHTDNRMHRFRNWDNLVYWFRGVEKFAPWVNKIHFVTWGHLPQWLNTEHPKLNIVKHFDYIPEKYLPTFSSHPIELNIHRIQGLAENFVYFNDDTFIISPVKKKDFFKNNLPCDSAVLTVHCYSMDKSFNFCPFRDIGIINKYFKMREAISNNPLKWFNPKYGKKIFRTIALLPCPNFPGMWQHHLPVSYTKSTFEEIWKREYNELNETCSHKFRHMLDYNQWLFREWQLASGNFYPRSTNIGKCFLLGSSQNASNACKYISKQNGKMVCVNDGEMTDEEFEKNRQMVIEAFKLILPDKSSFEI